jgi:hypothetical protein
MSGITRGFMTALHSTAAALRALGAYTLWTAPPASYPALTFLAQLTMALAGATASLSASLRQRKPT